MARKILITGIEGFTGTYLKNHFEGLGYDVRGTSERSCDITKKSDVLKTLREIKPDYIIHTAAISFVAHADARAIYDVNLMGTLNILEALHTLKQTPKKIILASSAAVYGNQNTSLLHESLCPKPNTHYGVSKLSMEQMAQTFFDTQNIIIVRPFNYTGVGQKDNFLIPKIVQHYKEKKQTIELGNLDVAREFNDIYYIVALYEQLLLGDVHATLLNLASAKAIKLLDIIEMMNDIAGYTIKTQINPDFVRANEIASLAGSTQKLYSVVDADKLPHNNIQKLLKRMYEA